MKIPFFKKPNFKKSSFFNRNKSGSKRFKKSESNIVSRFNSSKIATYAIAFAALALLMQLATIGKGLYVNANTPINDWGLRFTESGKQPIGNATSEYLAQFDGVFVGSAEEKVVYLTFDCGFHNENVEKVLDVLKAHDVKATFFIVGHYVNSAPEWVTRMAEDGHLIGNHTNKHPDMTKLSGDSFKEQLTSLETMCFEKTGVTVEKFYRPPAGKFNESNLIEAQKLGYKTVFWSSAYADWDEKKQPSPQTAMDTMMPRIHNGAIVLLHPTATINATIIDDFLTRLENQGYEFRLLNQL